MLGEQWWACRFVGERGQDCGGLFRDSVVNIGDDLMSNRTPLFIKCGDSLGGMCWVPNPSCHDQAKLRFCGHLMGACIRSEENLVIDLPPFVWKRLANTPTKWSDFEELSPQLARSIAQMDSEALSDDDFEALGLCFTFPLMDGKEVELVPGGSDRTVLSSERKMFCELARKACCTQFDSQLALMRAGLDEYSIPRTVLALWTPHEFEQQVSGCLDIPIDQMKEAVHLSGPSTQRRLFWEVIERLTMEQRGLLLKFASGRNRMPCEIQVKLGHGSGHFGTAATCSYEMFLPTYDTADEFYDGLIDTIACGDFGTT